MKSLETKTDWIEYLHNIETALLTANDYFNWSVSSERIRPHWASINFMLVCILLDYKENQWVEVHIPCEVPIKNPESIYLREGNYGI